VLHGREIDVAWRLASGALDLQPRKAAVDGLVDRGRRIDRFAVRPHPFVPTLAEQPVGLLQHGRGLGSHLSRLRCEDVCHRTRLAELLAQSLAVAAGKGRRVMLRGHPAALVFKRE
jgi:hypothetical protein